MSVRAGFGAMGSSVPQDFRKVYDVTLEGDTTDQTVDFEPESDYLLFQTAWTISTGKVSGYRITRVATPAPEAFGTVAASYTNFAAPTTDDGYTRSFKTNGTLTWKCASTAYRSRLIIYKIN